MIPLGAIADLLRSEKAVAAGILAICATVMVFTGEMTVDQWSDYTKWVLGIYVGGKTMQGVASSLRKPEDARASVDDEVEDDRT